MKRLLVVRHAESVGNHSHIIQGKNDCKGITKQGEEQIRKKVQENRQIFQGIDRIVTSSMKRAIETGKVINEFLSVPMEINPLLIEFDSGILAGKTHEQNEKQYPEYYKIWKNRGDLDGIPGAETGDELQARVISLLSQYIEKQEYNEVIVSHAGLIRCLVNTVQGKLRTTPVEVSNTAIHQLANPLENIKWIPRNRAMSSKVFIVDTADKKYVLKRKERGINQEDQLEKEILQRLMNKIDGIPRILFNTSIEENKSVKVISYLEGEHIYGALTREQEKAFLVKVLQIHEQLKGIDMSGYPRQSLTSLVEQKVKSAENSYVTQMGREILQDIASKRRIEKAEYCFVHDDLNRDNVLFNKIQNKEKVSIIDWESIKVLPKEYQLATFLASGLLIEGESMEMVMKISNNLIGTENKNYMMNLIQTRLFMGIHFFAENRFLEHENRRDAKEILKKYYIANEKLKQFKSREERMEEGGR